MKKGYDDNLADLAEPQELVHMSCFVDEEVDRHQRHQAKVLVVSHGAHFNSAGVFLKLRRTVFHTARHYVSRRAASSHGPGAKLPRFAPCTAKRASSIEHPDHPACGALGTILALVTEDGTSSASRPKHLSAKRQLWHQHSSGT